MFEQGSCSECSGSHPSNPAEQTAYEFQANLTMQPPSSICLGSASRDCELYMGPMRKMPHPRGKSAPGPCGQGLADVDDPHWVRLVHGSEADPGLCSAGVTRGTLLSPSSRPRPDHSSLGRVKALEVAHVLSLLKATKQTLPVDCALKVAFFNNERVCSTVTVSRQAVSSGSTLAAAATRSTWTSRLIKTNRSRHPLSARPKLDSMLLPSWSRLGETTIPGDRSTDRPRGFEAVEGCAGRGTVSTRRSNVVGNSWAHYVGS